MPSPAHRPAQGLCDGLADAARPQDVKLDGEICTYSCSIISNVVFVRADAARPQDVKLDGEGPSAWLGCRGLQEGPSRSAVADLAASSGGNWALRASAESFLSIRACQ